MKNLFHNCAVLKELTASSSDNKYEYAINISQLHVCLKSYNIMMPMIKGIKSAVKNVLENIRVIKNKIKVPIRPDRHNTRWGQFMKSTPGYRFTLDGCNYPKVRRNKGEFMTVSP